MDEFEAAQEDAYLEMFEEHRKIAVRDFQLDQLQAYYRAHPDLARSAFGFLAQARALVEASPSAAHVIAFAATEVGIKNLLLRPLLSGLVHTEGVAPFLAEVVFNNRSLEVFRPLLFDLLQRFGGIDLERFVRAGATATLWKEVTEHAKIRNAVVHRCEAATSQQAAAAIDVATGVLSELFPTVIGALGFHLHDGHRLCGEQHLTADMQALLDGVRVGRQLPASAHSAEDIEE